MRTQFQILLFIVCLNLATGLVIELSLPGTAYTSPFSGTSSTDYESHFNATEVASGWAATPYSGIPVIGDIFSAFNMLVRGITYMIAGFPLFLVWVGDAFITDATAMGSYNVIKGVLIAMFSLTMFWFFIEYISGRYVSD